MGRWRLHIGSARPERRRPLGRACGWRCDRWQRGGQRWPRVPKASARLLSVIGSIRDNPVPERAGHW